MDNFSATVALAGNPNCGKTTLFNSLTGLRHKVANYPGVTVEKKSAAFNLSEDLNVTLVDLPGLYSISTHSLDEAIASKVLLKEIDQQQSPDLIIAVLDASNLERNLYLTSQLLDLKLPLIVALNMSDVAERRGISIKTELLARELDVPVISVTATKGIGINQLKSETARLLQKKNCSSKSFAWLNKDQDAKFWQALVSLSQTQDGPELLHAAALVAGSLAPANTASSNAITKIRADLEQAGIDPYNYEATKRYQWIAQVIKRVAVVIDPNRKHLTDRIDVVVTHKVWGSLIFLLVMAGLFQAIFSWATIPMDLIDSTVGAVAAKINSVMPESKLRSLITDGAIAGVGSVLVFIPQIAILFLGLGILEESGYLTRAAFMMDRIMRKVGLQGRSFVPMLSSFACAIPGILATRTIPSFGDRMLTILVAPLMSCSARLPVYTVLIAAAVPRTYFFGFISLQGLVLLLMYLLGVIAAGAVAKIFKYFLFRGEPALFVMELPPFHIPNWRNIVREVIQRIVIFIESAGSVILLCSVVLWFLASFPGNDLQHSFAAQIGKFFEPVIRPLGYTWEIGVAILASFAAREVFVSSLATVLNLESNSDAAQSLTSALHAKVEAGSFSTLSAISLMVFYVFACMCMSTLAVCKRETGSWRWPALMFFYMTALAYLAALITYQGGLALGF